MEIGQKVFRMDLSNVKASPTRAMEFARATGRQILFMNPDGVLFNEAAEVTTYANDGSAVIVKVDFDGNFV